jgi:hypothetical protein
VEVFGGEGIVYKEVMTPSVWGSFIDKES